jgi:hypothetical protein
MRLAPDAVQNVESDSLTESYKRKFPLFHKLFLSGVENLGRPSGHLVIGRQGGRNSRSKFKIERQSRSSL